MGDPEGAERGSGWYVDPWGADSERWWDGRAWTGRTKRSAKSQVTTTEIYEPVSFTAAQIRYVEFRHAAKGYRRDQVDLLLEKMAEEVEAGRVPADTANSAEFDLTFKGYSCDEVDDFLWRVATMPAATANMSTSTMMFEATSQPPASLLDANVGAVTKTTVRRHPKRPHSKWLMVRSLTVATVVLVCGVGFFFAGLATWHTASSRPRVTAQVLGQQHCVTGNDSGTACDERIVFNSNGRQIHTVVKSIDPSRDLFGPSEHRSIVVFYDPTAPTHVEAVNGVAFDGIAMAIGGAAAIGGAVILAIRTRRTYRKNASAEPA